MLPTGFHRIRHYGLLANASRMHNLATARSLLQPTPHLRAEAKPTNNVPAELVQPTFVCRHCGAAMLIIDIVVRTQTIRAPPH